MVSFPNKSRKQLNKDIAETKKKREYAKILPRPEAQKVRDEINMKWADYSCPFCENKTRMIVYDFLKPRKTPINPFQEDPDELSLRMRLQCTVCKTKHVVYGWDEIPFLSSNLTESLLYLEVLFQSEEEEEKEVPADPSATVSVSVEPAPSVSDEEAIEPQQEGSDLPSDSGTLGPVINTAAYGGMEPDITYDGTQILVLNKSLPALKLNREKENPLDGVSISTLFRLKKRFLDDLAPAWDVLASLQLVNANASPSPKKAILQILFHAPAPFLEGFFKRTGYPFLSCRRPFLTKRFYYAMGVYVS